MTIGSRIQSHAPRRSPAFPLAARGRFHLSLQRFVIGGILPAIVLLSSDAISHAATSSSEASARGWWAHVRYLADDKLEGRLTGTQGYQKAADYVAAQFKECGLVPKGTDGYF